VVSHFKKSQILIDIDTVIISAADNFTFSYVCEGRLQEFCVDKD